MHTTCRLALAVLASIAAGQAAAHCFMVYDRQQRLVYQSTEAPFDLSQPLSQGLAANFPGHHLVMAQSSADCPAVDLRTRAALMLPANGPAPTRLDRRRARPPGPATPAAVRATRDGIVLR
jgi:hypothetical protein